MKQRAAIRLLQLLVTLALVATLAFAAKEYQAPRPLNAKSYPAHHEQPQEKVTVAADPYDTPAKGSIFALPYRDHGLLPVYLIITNDGDRPISLIGFKAEMMTAAREKITASDADDIRRRFTKVNSNPTAPSRVPLPLPRRLPKGSISREGLDEIDKAPFKARAVEPHSTQAGFVFFDVGDVDRPLSGANIYVSGLQDSSGQELIYFEIPLDKYREGASNPRD
jgi:hypothetical protein